MKYGSKILLLFLGLLLQAACSTQAVYTGESFASDSPFKMRADGEVAIACESARRSLLGQGYLIESASSDGVKGRKAYKTEDTQNTFIEMTVVCLPETNGSTLFATGVLTTYALKKSSSSASVGLSALGSISLPIGQSADSLVKISEETIDDKDFYKRFFTAVDTVLGEMQAGKAALEPLPASVAPEPGPALATPAAVPAPAPPLVAPTTATPPVPASVVPPRLPEPVTAQPVPTTVTTPLPTQAIPTPAPEPLPAQPDPAAVLEPFPTRAAPTTVLEPFPTRAVPTPAPAPLPPQSVPETVLAPFPVKGGAASTPEPPSPEITPAMPAEPAPAQETPITVLEQFTAPQIEPFK